ncbi:MATE family efflux transporter [Rheinheimera aquimaris]|uniref:MATE family efflux transporter n=1 Tax=Rheinheimera aquimaris TaxID=412437 RepID=UPI001E3098DB|nr:MATE family efflux transporter [Rheinheimera aquimaris]MCD1598259.1 MATE family efflux transporter [Rheinheimera aquimaris]
MTTLSAATTPAKAAAISKATTAILTGPIVPVMLKLALPTIAVLVVQTLVGVLETYFVSSLGAAVLAGVSVVFPLLMLMQMMANGGIGSGLSAAIARAIGAGDAQQAQALLWHGVLIALIAGLLFAAVLLAAGPALYQKIGLSGPALTAALTYSNLVFSSSPLIWLVALLSAALRGAGDTRTPARITLAGAAMLLPLSPLLIFGWGPLPAMGVAGAGMAIVVYYLLAALFLVRQMRRQNSILHLTTRALSSHLFKDILGVGLLASIGTVQINLTVLIVTATVGHFGPGAIAGFGIASRLEYIQVPLLFGLGTAIMTMVGINLGAGQIQRARRISWIGAGIAFAFTSALGLVVALAPQLWLNLFSDEPQVLLAGKQYLQHIAPFYGFIGAGMALYFAAIAMKRILWPVLAGTMRMIIAACGGWLAVSYFAAGMTTLFSILALGAVVYWAITLASIWLIGRTARLHPSQ